MSAKTVLPMAFVAASDRAVCFSASRKSAATMTFGTLGTVGGASARSARRQTVARPVPGRR